MQIGIENPKEGVMKKPWGLFSISLLLYINSSRDNGDLVRVLSHPHMVVIQPTGGQRDTMNTVRHQFNIAQDNYINIIPNILNQYLNIKQSSTH